MATLSEYFETEAREALEQIEAALDGPGAPDAQVLQRAARSLRGTAQLAREERVFRAGMALETAARALGNGVLEWTESMREAWRQGTADVRALVAHEDDDEAQDARVAAVLDRLRAAGAPAAASAPGRVATPAAEPAPGDFLRFAAQEVAGVTDALERAISQLATTPMDRDPLRAVLRRQRALLGSARIDEIPIVAEILGAIEDLTRVVAKLDVGVKQDWLDVYRIARDGLKNALAALERGENPQPTNASSRLRHMRAELLERFGAVEPAAAGHPAELFRATAAAPAAAGEPENAVLELGAAEIVDNSAATEPSPSRLPAGDAPDLLGAAASAMERAAAADVVPVEELCYTAEDALREALAMRDTILRATAHDPAARAAAEEIFDLIRYALG